MAARTVAPTGVPSQAVACSPNKGKTRAMSTAIGCTSRKGVTCEGTLAIGEGYGPRRENGNGLGRTYG